MMPNWQGLIGRRGAGKATDAPSSEDVSGSDVPPAETPRLADTLSAIQRERELHRRLVEEMERRGAEATADDLYEQVAAELERGQAATSDAVPRASTVAAARTGTDTPAWAAALLEEERTTNRLLARLVELAEARPPGTTPGAIAEPPAGER